jgi:hypothetical protein
MPNFFPLTSDDTGARLLYLHNYNNLSFASSEYNAKRDSNSGPFSSVRDLLNKSILGHDINYVAYLSYRCLLRLREVRVTEESIQ